MSLRVDDRGKSSRTRSRSRTRDRDRDDEREHDREKEKSKSKRSSRRVASDEDEEEFKMPGGFSQEDFENSGRRDKMPGGFSQDDFEQPAVPTSSSRNGKGDRRWREEDGDSEESPRTGGYDRSSRDAGPPQKGSRKSARFQDDDEDDDRKKPAGFDRLARDSEHFDSPPPPTSQASSSRHSKRASAQLAYPDDDHFMPKYPVDFPASPMSPTMPTRDPSAKYAQQRPYQYANPPDSVSYTSKPYPTSTSAAAMPEPMSPTSSPAHGHHRSASYSAPQPPPPQLDDSPGAGYPPTRTAKPPSELSREDKLERTKSASAASSGRGRDRGLSLSVNEPKKSALRAPSPSGAFDKPKSLSVGGLSVGGPQAPPPGTLPPGSPLLEAYKGTYQSISPIPSPLMMPADLDLANFSAAGRHGRDDSLDDMAALSLVSTTTSLSSASTRLTDKSKRRVKIYDAETDGEIINKALSHTSGAKPDPLIAVLPGLTHDQVLELRNSYKKTYKVAGRGINMTKHIKASTSGQFGKLAYVTSLGKWESEAYWANTWYQAHASSRELLIETLMGRTNADIREIKDAFQDKRYNDDLARALEKELKPDKFRMAVLLALQGKRQEETDSMPPAYRDRDVDYLAAALHEDKGGETAMLQIIVTRSDAHLRQVLTAYEHRRGSNFARDALRKSNNLVGETLAHILNGVINRAARDAALLRHAVEDVRDRNRAVELRYELLMSRLVRLHWDRTHLARVKEEYRSRYGVSLEREVARLGSGGFGEFCAKLCEV